MRLKKIKYTTLGGRGEGGKEMERRREKEGIGEWEKQWRRGGGRERKGGREGSREEYNFKTTNMNSYFK